MALRFTGKDVTVLSVGTLEPLAVYQRATIEFTADVTDTTAVKDEWYSAAIRRKSWRVTLSSLIESDPYAFLIALMSATETSPLTVTCTITDPNNSSTQYTFTGDVIPTSSTISLEDIMTRDLTLTGIGEPTIT